MSERMSDAEFERERLRSEADPPPFRSRVSWLTYLPNADTGADENYAVELERAINTPSRRPRAGSWIDEGVARDLEIGPGIAARPSDWTRQPAACSAPGKPLQRPATRHKTSSWDPDMPLEDAEPGRYGWRS